MTQHEAVRLLLKKPYRFGHMLGFDKLTLMHNSWIIDMVQGKEDKTLQAHRSSFKTTCVSIALAIICILFPNEKTIFLRKTDSDVKEIMLQVRKILKNPYTQYFVQTIYGVELSLIVENTNEITTNLVLDTRGTSQLYATGINGALTGKHFDRIFTDDIVNIIDRTSKAERDHTKLIYQELRNIVNVGGRIFNTGTPWHKDDCFTLMPSAEKFDCYSTGLLSDEKIKELRTQMVASLFAANYELRHIASDDVIFTEPIVNGDTSKIEQGICHIDAAYGGSDYTAFTIMNVIDGKYYVFGKCWNKHVDDCTDKILKYKESFMCGKTYCEDNGDKGYLAKELKRKGDRVSIYHEKSNKHLKICTYLKNIWNDIIFVDGTDKEYIEMICDYNEDAEHDDCPDSCASLARILYRKKNRTESEDYKPLFMGG